MKERRKNPIPPFARSPSAMVLAAQVLVAVLVLGAIVVFCIPYMGEG